MNVFEQSLRALLLAWYQMGEQLPKGTTPDEVKFRGAVLDGLRACGDIDPQLYESQFTEIELRRPWPIVDPPDDQPPQVNALRRVA